MTEKVDTQVESLLCMTMGGYLIIFDQRLYDWLKAQKIPGMVFDYHPIEGIAQVQIAPEDAREIYQGYLDSRKQARELVATGQRNS